MKQLLITAFLLSITVGSAQKKTPMKKAVCIEVVTFKGAPEYSIAQVEEAMIRTQEIIKEFDGFIKRTISVNEEGEFMDMVYWESLEQAKEAASKVQQNPQIMENFKVIDFGTITMKHFTSFFEAPSKD